MTGAHSGIGAAITKALIKHQMNVIGCARNFDKLKEFADGLEGPGTFVPVKCDVAKEDEVIEMMKIAKEKFGGVDVCVNNAASNYNTTILEGSVEDWKRIVEANILGMVQYVVQSLKLQCVLSHIF